MSTSVADQFTVATATGGATAPRGFTAAGLHCGIKAKAGALDLGLLAADTAVPAAGIFTTNLAQAAPITVSKRHFETNHGLVRAIVVNSAVTVVSTIMLRQVRQMNLNRFIMIPPPPSALPRGRPPVVPQDVSRWVL